MGHDILVPEVSLLTITIRTAAEADLPAVLAMSNALIAESSCNGLVPDDLDYLRGYRIHLAEADGQPIGYAYGVAAVSSRNIGSCRKGDRFYDLEMVYVKPEYRSCGAGRQLFTAQQEYARSLGLATLSLTAVNKDWKRLLHFYIDELGMDFFWATLSMDL